MQNGYENTYETAMSPSNRSDNEQPKLDVRPASMHSYLDLSLKLTVIASMSLVIIFLGMIALHFHHQGEGLQADRKKLEQKLAESLNADNKTVESLKNQMWDIRHEMKADLSAQKNFSTRQASEIKDIKSIMKEYCPLKYNGKCFWIEYREHPTINFQKGVEICAEQGGKPANIYSEDHFYIMMGYLGMFTRKRGVLHAWIGMTYNAQTKTASFSDGSPAVFTRWHPGHPSECCNMGLKANAEWQSENQYLFTHKGPRAFEGVICER